MKIRLHFDLDVYPDDFASDHPGFDAKEQFEAAKIGKVTEWMVAEAEYFLEQLTSTEWKAIADYCESEVLEA